MTELILSERKGAVRTLSLNRPEKHNAMDDEMGALFRDCLERALSEEGVNVILINARGKSFCAGRDVGALGKRSRDESDFHFVGKAQQSRLAMLDSDKTIIVALKGGVIGGGCELALAADIRIADTTLSMALPEIDYGLLPDTGGTQLLTAMIGPSRAKYMIMTGRSIDAPTALEWGAVDFVVPPKDLDKDALDIASAIAARPPINLAMAKQMVNFMHAPTIRTGTRAELYAQSYLFKTQDYEEARAARREHRVPIFRGK